MEYIIKNNDLTVTVSSLGAEMVTVKYKNEERLWQNDNNTWTGHAPVLFPIAGKIDVYIDKKKYELKQHGFARRMEFELVSKEEDFISFVLKDNELTHEVYPYSFNLVISYKLFNNSIKVKYEIINTDKKEIYASIGGHTSFALKDTVDKYNLIMEDDKELYSLNVTDGLLDGSSTKVSDNGIIDLSSKCLKDAKTIIMDSVKSHKVVLEKKSGEKVVQVEFSNFPHLLLWHPLDSKMICIEPWHNLLDHNHDEIEFKDKYSIIKIEKDSKEEFIQIYTYY